VMVIKRSAQLSGDVPQQKARTRTLDKLPRRYARGLVATDVAGRGFTWTGISHVIKLPPCPDDRKTTSNRIGAPAGPAQGTRISFACEMMLSMIRRLKPAGKTKWSCISTGDATCSKRACHKRQPGALGKGLGSMPIEPSRLLLLPPTR